ncbi:hypothetical protein JCM8547_000100 [Rhodosporidiobolus lusitaniae]
MLRAVYSAYERIVARSPAPVTALRPSSSEISPAFEPNQPGQTPSLHHPLLYTYQVPADAIQRRLPWSILHDYLLPPDVLALRPGFSQLKREALPD